MKTKIFLLLILSCSVAHAQFMSGNQLKEHCNKNNDSPVGVAVCLGYVQGIADANDPLFCFPRGVVVGQLSAIVKKYLNDNPAQLHLSGDMLVTHAFRQSFPCPKK